LINIRIEQLGDVAAVREVNQRAFGQDLEANIVDALRSNGAALLSLVATLNGNVAGHIMYSPALVGGEGGGRRSCPEVTTGAALGPMAVLPEYQRQGIGSRLVEAGSQMLKEAGCPFIVVVGHADYYPRFGFRPARAQRIDCQWEVPDDVFMLLVLDQAKMRGVAGLARYRDEFSSVS